MGGEHIEILLSALRDNNIPNKQQLAILRSYDESVLSQHDKIFIDSEVKWDEKQALSAYERYIKSGKNVFMSFEIPALNNMKRERFFKEFGNAVKPRSMLDLKSSLSLKLIDNVLSQCQDLPIRYNGFLYSMKFGGSFFETQFNNSHKVYSTSSISNKSAQINISDFEHDMRDFFESGLDMAIKENNPDIFARLINAGYLNALYQYQENDQQGIEKASNQRYTLFLDKLIKKLCTEGRTQMLSYLLKSHIPGFTKQELKSYLQDLFMEAIHEHPLPISTAFQSSDISVNFERNNETPLIAAIKNGDIQKIDVVLNSKSIEKIINKNMIVHVPDHTKPNATTVLRQKPIMFAASRGNLDALHLLMEHGAKFDAKDLIIKHGSKFKPEELIACILEHTDKYKENYLRGLFYQQRHTPFIPSNIFSNTLLKKNTRLQHNPYLDTDYPEPRVIEDDFDNFSTQSAPRGGIKP